MEIKQTNPKETLYELMTGILSSGILIWIVVIWLVEKKMYFSIGLGIGIVLAILAACHMWWSLDRGMELGGGASKYLLSQNMVRYGVIIFSFGVICVADVGSPLAAFAGIMCLKWGAYLQPFTHKILSKIRRR